MASSMSFVEKAMGAAMDGFTGAGYMALTKYRDTSENGGSGNAIDSGDTFSERTSVERTSKNAFDTFSTRFIAELGFAALAVAGTIETVVRATLFILAELARALIPESIQKQWTYESKDMSGSKKEPILSMITETLSASTFVTAEVTVTCVANLINNLYIDSLLERNDLRNNLWAKANMVSSARHNFASRARSNPFDDDDSFKVTSCQPSGPQTNSFHFGGQQPGTNHNMPSPKSESILPGPFFGSSFG